MIERADEKTEQQLGLAHKFVLAADRGAPVVVLVHGRAGTFDLMWAFRRCLPEPCSILAVQAPLVDPIGGYSWWRVEGERASEAAPRAAQQVEHFLTNALARYALTPRRRLALGFSQGAGTLSVVAQQHPALFHGVGLLAGFVVEVPESTDTARPEIFMAHGSADETVPLERAEAGADFLRARGYPLELHVDPVGHKVGAPALRALKVWSHRVLAA